MTGRTFLCLFLFAVSVSAHGRHKNRMTECGLFRTSRNYGFFDFPLTDVDTVNALNLVKALDSDNNGYVTYAEATNEATYLQLDSRLTYNTGVARCVEVSFTKKYLGLKQEVANALFTVLDTDKNGLLSFSDNFETVFMESDTNGNRQVSICELFRTYMDAIATAENNHYKQKTRIDNLVHKFSRKWDIFSWLNNYWNQVYHQ